MFYNCCPPWIFPSLPPILFSSPLSAFLAQDHSFSVTLTRQGPAGPDSHGLTGSLELLLYDENVFKDKHAGTIRVDLAQLTPAQLSYCELPFVSDKKEIASQQRNSRLALSICPGILTYHSLRTMWGSVPGMLCNDVKQHIYLPLPDASTPGVMYLGIEYEGGVVDFKVGGARVGRAGSHMRAYAHTLPPRSPPLSTWTSWATMVWVIIIIIKRQELLPIPPTVV